MSAPEKPAPIVIEIDPATWDRGGRFYNKPGGPLVTLLGVTGAAEGMKCCMGFAALALGATEDEIAGHGNWITCLNPRLSTADYIRDDSPRFSDVYKFNDDRYLTDAQRVDLINGALARIEEEDGLGGVPSFRFRLKTA